MKNSSFLNLESYQQLKASLVQMENELNKQLAKSQIPTVTIDLTVQKPTSSDQLHLFGSLGKGNYATVYCAQQKGTNKLCALKVIQKELIQKLKKEHQIQNEIDILDIVDSDFLTKLQFCFESDKRYYFGIDYCSGGNFYELLKKSQKLSERQTKFYISQLILAIQHLHSLDILHRDLKLENILLNSDGYLKLTDFGLSKQNIQGNTQAQGFCGTPFYMAPEIVMSEVYGKTVDWYAIGVILYEMLTGKPPFHDSQPQDKLWQDVLTSDVKFPSFIKGDLKDLLKGLLNKDPRKRLGANGAQEIIEHKWFENFNWQALEAKQIIPPYVPKEKYFPLKKYYQINVSNLYEKQEIKESKESKYYSEQSTDDSAEKRRSKSKQQFYKQDDAEKNTFTIGNTKIKLVL